jgi:PPK2 family polyphosphate:nucleotide phosphotransferase
MTKINPKAYRLVGDRRFRLKDWPTIVEAAYQSQAHYEELLHRHVAELSCLQEVLYASNAHAILMIFQGMDTAGKDGSIRHVMSGVNPQGCEVFSFKQPSAEELDHDFLWRSYQRLPERGRIGIFNRSYYEDVIVVRVHPELLAAAGFDTASASKPKFWESRYRSIVNLEDHLHRNGTRVLKFYLHLSKAEQRKRLLERIDDPTKNWKFSAADVDERKLWKEYMRAYEECLAATATEKSPWYVIPADNKLNARLIISEIFRSTLEDLKMTYPKAGPERTQELQTIRQQLEKQSSTVEGSGAG